MSNTQNATPSVVSNVTPNPTTHVVKQKKHREYCRNSTYTIFHMIVGLFALYLSFRCNKTFDFGSFLAALFCPYLYILYKFATSDSFCGLNN
jgi:hypothetical protein